MDSDKEAKKQDNSSASQGSGIAANRQSGASKESLSISIPQITLPKGGGALKGIDEKFHVNAANGTASFTVAIPFSKTRSDFAPHLALSYNSGSGNSPFGLGWNVDLPAIHRRTEKMLPQYKDADESDVFQFSGVEDLVPAYISDGHGNWSPDTFAVGKLIVKRYKPRIEGSFTRIEKILLPDYTAYWKATTRNNTVTYFGFSASSRIADPNDATHIFKWLPEFCFDDK